MKKYNRVIALILLLRICFPIINPISNIVYASEDGQIIEEEEVKENEENLTAKELSEELLKIKEKTEKLDQDLLDKSEIEKSELLEELKSEIEELENILKVKEEKEAEESEKPKEQEDENELEKENIEEIEELKKEIKKILEELEELIKEINESEISKNYNTNKKSRRLKLTEYKEKLNDFKNQLDNDLNLEELENLKEEVTLFKTEVADKLKDLNTKNSDRIVYIVTDQDETLTKEKYKEEFGDVIVTNHLIKIFEEVRYDKTKYLTKEEA